MSSFSIVERFDVIRDIICLQIAVLVDVFLDAFLLEATQEGLSNRAIPAVSAPAHAGLQVDVEAESSPVIATVLATLIRVDDRFVRVTLFDSHHDRVQHEFPIDCRASRPTDDLSGKQIHDDGQVKPSLPSSDVCDIRHPDSIRLRYFEVSFNEIRDQPGRLAHVRTPSSIPWLCSDTVLAH